MDEIAAVVINETHRHSNPRPLRPWRSVLTR
jgi:hypothetical protein